MPNYNPNITNLDVPVNAQPTILPNSKAQQMPWLKAKVEQQKATTTEETLPDSSFVPANNQNTSGSKILSVQSTHSISFLLYPIILLVILIVPCILLVATSYNNWPSSLPIPEAVKYQTDLLILKSPLTPTANQLFRVATINLSQQQSFSHQLTIKARQAADAEFSTNISGVSDNPLSTADITIASKYQHQNSDQNIDSKIIIKNNRLYFQINQLNPNDDFNFQPINNQWISIPNIIEVTQTTSPGEIALAKIRNKKNQDLLENFLKDIYDNSVILYSEPGLPETHYLVSYTMPAEKLPNLLQELLLNYQDSNLDYFSESQFKLIQKQIETSLSSRIKFEILINKETLLPDRIDATTIIIPPTTHSLSNFEKIQQKLITEVDYTPTYSNTTINPNTPPNAIPNNQINWTNYINHPILRPLVDNTTPLPPEE